MNIHRTRAIDRFLGQFLMMLLRPTGHFIALFLKRDHTLDVRGDVAVIKMLGGGSLLIAYPALLALRNRYPNARFLFVGTPDVTPFAQLTGIFDAYHEVVGGKGLVRLMRTSWSALRACRSIDTIIDLEVYSQLTTIFSVMTLARNRIGFYLDIAFWRKGLTTHLFFFNRASGRYVNYGQIAQALGAPVGDIREAWAHFAEINQLPARPPVSGERLRLGLGNFCSDTARERELSAKQWAVLLLRKFAPAQLELHLFGSKSQNDRMATVERELLTALPGIAIRNHCGQFTLQESTRQIARLDEFWTIDTGLLHIARLVGIPVTSFWGATDPATLIAPMPDLRETVFYHKIHCSPCVHQAEFPPCLGNNICMSQHTETLTQEELTRPWIIS